jgi:hypothetical protein
VLSQGARRLVGWLELEAQIQMDKAGGIAPDTRP